MGKEVDRLMNINAPGAMKIHRASLKLIGMQNEARSLAHKAKVRKMLIGFNLMGKGANPSDLIAEASV